jgi:hypothetical protein
MKNTLELPKTLRLIEVHEAPNDPKVQERIKLSKTANIVEGYTIHKSKENTEFPFAFFAEVNVNNSRLWNVFLRLSDELPEEVSLIFNVSDGEVNYGTYTSKIDTLNFLKHYQTELVADTLLEIGMLFQTDDILVEVFIADCKYIKFWGMDETSFINIMKAFQLNEIKDLNFIDEFPKVRQGLYTLEPHVKQPHELQQIFDEEFQFVNLQ